MTRHGLTAMTRAAARWQEAALYQRGELRASGVRGDLRTHDDIAAGRRGLGVAKGVSALALEMRGAGLAPVEITARLQRTVAAVVDAALQPETRTPAA
jgi:hypothetical protein